jgi:hypothetical protein
MPKDDAALADMLALDHRLEEGERLTSSLLSVGDSVDEPFSDENTEMILGAVGASKDEFNSRAPSPVDRDGWEYVDVSNDVTVYASSPSSAGGRCV